MFTYLDNLYIDILRYWTDDQLTITRDCYRHISQLVIQDSEDIICIVSYSSNKQLTFNCELLKPRSRVVLAHCEVSMYKVASTSQFNFRKSNGNVVRLSKRASGPYIINYIQGIFSEYEHRSGLNNRKI